MLTRRRTKPAHARFGRSKRGGKSPVRQYGQAVGPLADAFQKDATGTARINNKLNTIIIPRIEFRDASIREAIDFLRQQAAANDPATDGRKGVDIVLRLTPSGGAPPPASTPAGRPSAGTSAGGRKLTGTGWSRHNGGCCGCTRSGSRDRACVYSPRDFSGGCPHHHHAQSNSVRRSAPLHCQPGRVEGQD